MLQDSRFAEDLPDLAAQAYRLAGEKCGPCRTFHMIWPYLRLAGASGSNVRAPDVVSAIAQAAAGRRRRFLIAGAADTGLLAMVARATMGHNSEITVLDRCETPLELCRRFSQRWSLPIETLHVDLQNLSTQAAFDIVFAHSILQFIAADRRRNVLSRLCHSLRPDGRMVMMFRTGNRVETNFISEYRTSYAENLIKRLDDRNIALPEPRDAFLRRVENYADERRAREGALRDRAEVEEIIAEAGFVIESVTPTEVKLAMPFRDIPAKLSKQHFLVIAKPR